MPLERRGERGLQRWSSQFAKLSESALSSETSATILAGKMMGGHESRTCERGGTIAGKYSTAKVGGETQLRSHPCSCQGHKRPLKTCESREELRWE